MGASRIRTIREAAVAELGEEGFELAREAGRALSIDTVLAVALGVDPDRGPEPATPDPSPDRSAGAFPLPRRPD